MLSIRRFGRVGAFLVGAMAALVLASCTDVAQLPKQVRPFSSETRALLVKNDMDEKSPILVRIFKEDSSFEVWKQQKTTGRFALVKSYQICKWSGGLGPKVKEGDRQSPEGFYTIYPGQMNPKSAYYLSFNIGFPNAYDRAHSRTGVALMVHGICSSAGCYAMNDDQMQEIWTFARTAFEGGQRAFQVQAYPFRMTPENMAKHYGDPNMPFWKMLKVGYDHFEVTHQEPKVDVCSGQYVFNSNSQNGIAFNPTGACPVMTVPEPLRVAVAQKEAQDDAKTQIVLAQLQQDQIKSERREQDKLNPHPTMLASIFGAPKAAEATKLSTPAAPAPTAVAQLTPAVAASAQKAVDPIHTGSIQKAPAAVPATAKAKAAPVAVSQPMLAAREPAAAPASDFGAEPPVGATAYAESEQPKHRSLFARLIGKNSTPENETAPVIPAALQTNTAATAAAAGSTGSIVSLPR
ncbi:Murein L,D-transpeptidase YafK [Faunimonas pinastri]|uniref:Murein L,D-transpeptidase YafK n=1 Tax=Faunimonas pinastri TaxID=1855383 RepID=A0A1H9C6S4_9HYPH|nr:murein L,D-transpeptidase family protein [Faunimonas pinastri]SEP96834.1 Murein L,D-transpeptidase YafK [Faunimonas pinastri]